MKILILSNETARTLIATQTGQHRLGPVPLADGRSFLSADVLLESNLFADRMVGVEYEHATLESVQFLILTSEDEL